MSETLGAMKQKIKSADDLHSVVRAMKATAAANIGQYQKSVLALGDYERTVELALSLCLKQTLGSDPMRRISYQSSGPIVMVVFGSDQGLVGRFNDAIADDAVKTLNTLPSPKEVWAVGERVNDCLKGSGISSKGVFAVPTSIEAVVPLVSQILIQTKASTLFLVSNRPLSAATCEPFTQRLLPLDREWVKNTLALKWPNRNLPEVAGDTLVTLKALIHEYLFVSIFRACAESLASENATRLAAMQRADKSIDSLVKDLTTSFHRVRQSQIDEELFDVIAGFNALSEKAN